MIEKNKAKVRYSSIETVVVLTLFFHDKTDSKDFTAVSFLMLFGLPWISNVKALEKKINHSSSASS